MWKSSDSEKLANVWGSRGHSFSASHRNTPGTHFHWQVVLWNADTHLLTHTRARAHTHQSSLTEQSLFSVPRKPCFPFRNETKKQVLGSIQVVRWMVVGGGCEKKLVLLTSFICIRPSLNVNSSYTQLVGRGRGKVVITRQDSWNLTSQFVHGQRFMMRVCVTSSHYSFRGISSWMFASKIQRFLFHPSSRRLTCCAPSVVWVQGVRDLWFSWQRTSL